MQKKHVQTCRLDWLVKFAYRLCTIPCALLTTPGILPYQYESDFAIAQDSALTTASETGIRSFCGHDVVFALRFTGFSSLHGMVNTLACIDNHLVQSKSKSIIGLGSHRSIFSGREHDQKKKSICPTEDCMRACVMRRDVSRTVPPPALFSTGKCLQMLRVYYLGHNVCDTAYRLRWQTV